MTVILQILLWRTLAVLSLLLGVIGLLLPIMPTVPFLLVAAWAGGKGWPVLEAKLLAHPKYGPQIIAWRRYGVVKRQAKVIAIVMMTGSAIMLSFSPAHLAVKLTVIGIMLIVAVWLSLRPEHTPAQPIPAEKVSDDDTP
ncbi:YbaN family protein [Pseudidiomarina terrestris]|uniref:YbaN family protein n=1 Tax=Pseudidiomarina terrestris TaxID=2820060 RepID=A0AAW7QZ99_9GAMM|nr:MULTISPECIES: YbaN family protein [unclassified Pseudidiomarina]MDN7124767.1 YbaN family protein [Pseudidiomarina sp. 1APP75-32.1]MDN7125824.1 YbaN family protein [Pseudidiomarina sp. 1APR75-33.1]MDN7129759.1 YbaN family protein [Pseudidiomarina sp. 1APR75-15]MDN7136463.1 YbaN family protein [Pseudidiomarina sp. 1ASP75-5]MDN7137984.1 YbaN family protein [Pseudidiomarina sp. 1ASP75-14]